MNDETDFGAALFDRFEDLIERHDDVLEVAEEKLESDGKTKASATYLYSVLQADEPGTAEAPEHRDRCWLEVEKKRELRIVGGQIGLEAPRPGQGGLEAPRS